MTKVFRISCVWPSFLAEEIDTRRLKWPHITKTEKVTYLPFYLWTHTLCCFEYGPSKEKIKTFKQQQMCS